MATNPFPQHREPSPGQIREPEPPPTARHRDNPSANFTPRRHTFQTLRGSPPSQRRSQFNSMAEKFLKLEEQRLSHEGRVVKVMEEMAQTHNVLAEGVKALGEGLKAMGEGLRLLAESL
ncbi:uncharacterized protein LOC124537758 [Vanessa cardui]|uniref:uncharacterized protein LOC124537758 n=1 Tax=Vanessa cardui TaxID=171605 RepID=UPI001F133F47|nr:uncharacterized protein LOC124537758 [Vanessa cardui]